MIRRGTLGSALVLALAVAGAAWASPVATSAQHRRAPLQAFVLASAPDSLADLQAHAGTVGVVYPTYFDCAIPGGAVTGRDSRAITSYARAQRITVMPRFNCQDGETVHRILTEPELRARTLARLAYIGTRSGYRGLCLDLENDGPGDREALSTFVASLAHALHVHKRRLTVVVDGVTAERPGASTGFYDDRAIGAAADTVFVLAWGAHWERSAPGPIAPIAFVTAIARYVSSLPNASRYVLGAPMYGLDWPGGGGPSEPARAYQYAAILALARAVGATPVRDAAVDELTFAYTDAAGTSHHVWFLDARAVADRLQIGRSLGLAVGVWRLGREDQALWSSAPVR